MDGGYRGRGSNHPGKGGEKWVAENSFDANDVVNLEPLAVHKREQELTVSPALPTFNEEQTVSKAIHAIQRVLMDKAPLLDDIVSSTWRARQ
jgi:hypothetical protein